MFRVRIYDTVELPPQPRKRPKQDVKAATVALQENPSYLTKNEFS